jgi:hypothetical protein
MINLGLIRLVSREWMIGESNTAHEAEVLLSGLLAPAGRDADRTADPNPDHLRYDFDPEVRELLLNALPAGEARAVLVRVLPLLPDPTQQLAAVRVALTSSAAVPDGLGIPADAVVRIAADVLRRIGGPTTRLFAPSTRPPPRPAPVAPIRILHLADLHFQGTMSPWMTTMLETLPAEIARIAAEGHPPDVVAITGDIVAEPRAAAFTRARRWIDEQLLPALDQSVGHSRVIMVPGNHDFRRSSSNMSRVIFDAFAKAWQSARPGSKAGTIQVAV